MADRYVYTNLPSDHHIRILEVQPSLDPSSPLHCDLIHSDLNKDGDGYETLSYTWGAHVFSETIVIGSSDVIHVTAHLAAALRHFRLPLRPRRIWADAICINQTDAAEKGTQIPLMSRIYRCASRVLVWLGVGDEAGSESAAVRSINFHGRLLQSQQPRGLDARQKSLLNAALVRFLGLAWFRRRWIIQEVVLNHDINLFCGSAEVSWLCLLTTIDYLGRALPDEIRETADSLMTMFNLWKYKVLRDSKQGRCGILPLMISFDQFNCFDSRDRIFAIAALADDTLISSRAVKGSPRIIQISTDYSLSTEEVYVNFAASAISSGHLTWLLRQAVARNSPRARSLPPWAPDWRNPICRRPLHSHHNVTMAEFSGDAKSRFSTLKVLVDFYDRWQNVYRSASSNDEFLPRGASQVVEVGLSEANGDRGSAEEPEEQEQEHFSQRDRVRSAMDKLGWRALSTQEFVPLAVVWKSDAFPSTARESSVISWIRKTCASLWSHVMQSIENNDYLVDHFGLDDTDSVAEIKLDHEQYRWLSYSFIDILGDRWSTSSQGGYNSKETSRYPVMERCPWDDPWGEEDPASVLCYAETSTRGPRKQRRCAVHIVERLLKDLPCEPDELSSLLRAISEVMGSRRMFAGAGVMMTRENYKLFEISLGVGNEDLREGDHIVSPVAEAATPSQLQMEALGISRKPLTYTVRHHHSRAEQRLGSKPTPVGAYYSRYRPDLYRFVGECRVRLNTLKLEVGAAFWNSSDVTRDTVAGRYDRTVFIPSLLRHDEWIYIRFD